MLYAAAAAAKSLQSCLTLCDPIDAAHQAPPSLGFSRQEYYIQFLNSIFFRFTMFFHFNDYL